MSLPGVPLTDVRMNVYEEISKTRAAVLASLKTRKMRVRHGLFLAEGAKCVSDTLGAFRLEWLVATRSWLEGGHPMPGVDSSRVLVASDGMMRKISSLSSAPDVIAVFRLPEDDGNVPLIPREGLHLLLDGIQDPGNLGTIIRTADWFGFTRIYASRDTVDVFNPKTVQSTMGSLRRVEVVYTDLPELIERSGVRKVFGTLLDGRDMFREELGDSGVIVMGNEGNGLSEKIRHLVNHPLLIPPYNKEGHGESLNVAVATAITLARFRNQ